MKRLIVALACALVASTAHADHWFSLGYIDEASMLVNVDSFNTDEDGYCGVWVGYVYPYRNDYTFEMAFLKFSEIAFKEALQKYPEQSFAQKFGLCNR